MPGFFTDYANNKVLDLLFGAVNLAPPATIYLGLAQNSANKSGLTTEPSGGGYSRVAVANTGVNFPAAGTGTKSNATVITFPAPTGDWGVLKSLFVADAATGGNVIAMADLSASRAISSGTAAPKVAAGAFFLSHT